MNKIATFMRESQTAIFFIPVGIFLMIFGIVVLVIDINNKNYIKVESTVTKSELLEDEYTDIDGNIVEATYEVFIKYTVNNKEYETSLSGLPEYKKGEKMTIYYNPDDPSEITQSKNIVIPIVVLIFGIISFCFGIFSGIKSYKKNKGMKIQEESWSNE